MILSLFSVQIVLADALSGAIRAIDIATVKSLLSEKKYDVTAKAKYFDVAQEVIQLRREELIGYNYSIGIKSVYVPNGLPFDRAFLLCAISGLVSSIMAHYASGGMRKACDIACVSLFLPTLLFMIADDVQKHDYLKLCYRNAVEIKEALYDHLG